MKLQYTVPAGFGLAAPAALMAGTRFRHFGSAALLTDASLAAGAMHALWLLARGACRRA